MIKFLLWIWQLPQNLAGWIYSRFAKNKIFVNGTTVYFAPCFDAGITLGQYIILDYLYEGINPDVLLKIIKHEYGHSIQSKYLGWFYLVVVGIPSVIRNIMSRMNPKKYNSDWYYSGYPEKWADKLGGVKRYWKNTLKNL